MAYADRNTGGSRVVAIVLVALIVAGMGYAFVTGLAYQYIKKKAEELKTFEVEEPPPPPEEVPPPPPPPDTPVPPPPTQVVVPPARVQVPVPAPPMSTTTIIPPSPPISPPAPPAPPSPPAPPAAAPAVISKAAAARGNPGEWVTNDDYPASALRNEEEGSVGISFNVNARGRVEGCSVTAGSGSRALDDATCRLVTSRGRYSPALDAAGNPIAGGRKSLRFTWKIAQ